MNILIKCKFPKNSQTINMNKLRNILNEYIIKIFFDIFVGNKKIRFEILYKEEILKVCLLLENLMIENY